MNVHSKMYTSLDYAYVKQEHVIVIDLEVGGFM